MISALDAGRRVGYLAVSSSAAGARGCVTCPVNSSAPASEVLGERRFVARWAMNRDVADRTIRSAEVIGALRPIGRTLSSGRSASNWRQNSGASSRACASFAGEGNPIGLPCPSFLGTVRLSAIADITCGASSRAWLSVFGFGLPIGSWAMTRPDSDPWVTRDDLQAQLDEEPL